MVLAPPGMTYPDPSERALPVGARHSLLILFDFASYIQPIHLQHRCAAALRRLYGMQ